MNILSLFRKPASVQVSIRGAAIKRAQDLATMSGRPYSYWRAPSGGMYLVIDDTRTELMDDAVNQGWEILGYAVPHHVKERRPMPVGEATIMVNELDFT